MSPIRSKGASSCVSRSLVQASRVSAALGCSRPSTRSTSTRPSAELGGHAHDGRCLDSDGSTFPVDTGFQVFNRRTYPNLIRFFERLGIEHSDDRHVVLGAGGDEDIEWSGTSLNTVFAQRKNIANPRFLQHAHRRPALQPRRRPAARRPHRRRAHARPAARARGLLRAPSPTGTSSPWATRSGRRPPARCSTTRPHTFLRFCDNHGLLHITGKPLWLSVIGGSRVYVERASRSFSGEVHSVEPVERVERTATGVRVHTARRSRDYDAVILATHPPQTLEILGDGGDSGTSARSSRPSTTGPTTSSCTPTRRSCPSSSARGRRGTGTRTRATSARTSSCSPTGSTRSRSCPRTCRPSWRRSTRHRPFAEGTVLAELSFDHPMYTKRPSRAAAPAELQGVDRVWFAGAWTRYGFHEDGILSAVRVAEALGRRAAVGRGARREPHASCAEPGRRARRHGVPAGSWSRRAEGLA